jgi:hypothetical protein
MDNGQDNDVDVLIQTLKEKQEIDDFIINGNYPARLKSTCVRQNFPKLEEQHTHIPDLLHENENYNIKYNFNNIRESLNALELELKKEIQREITEIKKEKKYTDCPICMEEIKERNYVMPKCGHPICVNCFVINIKINNKTGHLCSQCRQGVI